MILFIRSNDDLKPAWAQKKPEVDNVDADNSDGEVIITGSFK